MKPGFLTSEFWATAATAGGALAIDLGAGSAVSGDVKDAITAGGALVVAVYTLVRGRLKKAQMMATSSASASTTAGPPAT